MDGRRHADINMTLNTYLHVLPSMQENAALKIYEQSKNRLPFIPIKGIRGCFYHYFGLL